MEMVMRRTERGFRGKCEGYNVWLSDKTRVPEDVHILHGDFMITGAVMSKTKGHGIHALIVTGITKEDTLYEHSGFIATDSGVTARTLQGEFLSPGKMKDLIYDAPMPPPLGMKSPPLPPIINGKVYARMHDGRLRVVGIPDVRGVREVVMKGGQYKSYLLSLEAYQKRQANESSMRKRG